MMLQQISQRGKEYLKTAETLLRAAQTMTDQAIAGQLEALANDYQRRAEKASHVDAAKAFTLSATGAEREWRTGNQRRLLRGHPHGDHHGRR